MKVLVQTEQGGVRLIPSSQRLGGYKILVLDNVLLRLRSVKEGAVEKVAV